MISQTAEYALRASVRMAAAGSSALTIEELAAQTQVPAGYLAKVLQTLGRAGLVRSRRGLGGGFVLAKPAEALRLLEVINAVDPIKRIRTCPLAIHHHGSALCPLHRRLDDAIALVEKAYGSTTVKQLVEEPATCRAMTGRGPGVTRGKPAGKAAR